MNTPAGLWVLTAACFGAVVGSFINVVIFRLPRGLSIRQPRRSFCPACGQTIRALDNVPVLSWLLLGGRCRHCRAAIPLVYPVVELLTALLFVMVWDALFVGNVMGHAHPAAAGVAYGGVMIVIFAALFAGLLACSVMDVEEYLIDIRVTHVIMAVGVIGHTLAGLLQATATASPLERVGRLGPGATLVGVALLVGWVLTERLFLRRMGRDHHVVGDECSDTNERPPEENDGHDPPHDEGASPVPVWLLSAAVATVAVAITWNPMYAVPWTLTPTQIRALAGLFILLVVLIAAGMAPRPSDQRMEATIQHERPQARRTAMRELLARLPAVVLAVAVGWVWLRYGRTGLTWTEASESWGRLLVGALAGGGSAAAAMMLAAGVGWFVRIFFTLVFGKEAYGVGDIYLMAAIAAVGGVWLSVFAFFLGAMLALVGVLAFILRKSSRALPFGPWLSVGALAALWMHDAAVRYVQKGAAEIWWMLKNALRNGV